MTNTCTYCGAEESLTEIHVERNIQTTGYAEQDVMTVAHVCPDPECVAEARAEGAEIDGRPL